MSSQNDSKWRLVKRLVQGSNSLLALENSLYFENNSQLCLPASMPRHHLVQAGPAHQIIVLTQRRGALLKRNRDFNDLGLEFDGLCPRISDRLAGLALSRATPIIASGKEDWHG